MLVVQFCPLSKLFWYSKLCIPTWILESLFLLLKILLRFWLGLFGIYKSIWGEQTSYKNSLLTYECLISFYLGLFKFISQCFVVYRLGTVTWPLFFQAMHLFSRPKEYSLHEALSFLLFICFLFFVFSKEALLRDLKLHLISQNYSYNSS